MRRARIRFTGRVHPSRRALVLVAAGAGLATLPILVSPGLWVIWVFAWTLLLLLFLSDALLAPRESDLELVTPDTLYMGATSQLELRLSLRGRPVAATVRLDLSDTLVPASPQRATLGPEPETLRFPLTPRRRGQALLETAWLRYAGPFGLLERTLRIPLNTPIDAVPNIRSVRRLALEFFSPDEFRVGLRIEQFSGDGSEFDSLREFMPGLDHRAIDWKASARHGQLLCRQFRAERNRQIVFAIDAGHLMAEPLANLPRLDHAIHAALLLSYFSVRAGDKVGLFHFDERPRGFTEPRPGMPAFRAMLKLSGGIAYTDAETNYTLGLTELMGHLNRRSLVVVLTDFVDTVTAELMLDNIERLARRHLVIFVSLRDPLLDRVASAEPRDLNALGRAVVADSLLRERELVVTRLRRKGIFCVDAAPEQLGVQLVNRYLEIKRREMI